jgi:hypothetical protein
LAALAFVCGPYCSSPTGDKAFKLFEEGTPVSSLKIFGASVVAVFSFLLPIVQLFLKK